MMRPLGRSCAGENRMKQWAPETAGCFQNY